MTVNVYTYYENKLALEKARRACGTPPRKARRRLLPLGPMTSAGIMMGLVVAMGVALVEPVAPLEALTAGCAAWGGLCGLFLDWLTGRFRRMMAALRGEPLTLEDIRDLSYS